MRTSVGLARSPCASSEGNTMLAALPRHALALLRIVAALLFMEHGTQKLLGFPAAIHGLPPLLSLQGVAGVLEGVGGLLLLLGVQTRAVAFVLAGEMATAYWTAHAARSFFPAVNGGDAAIL